MNARFLTRISMNSRVTATLTQLGADVLNAKQRGYGLPGNNQPGQEYDAPVWKLCSDFGAVSRAGGSFPVEDLRIEI